VPTVAKGTITFSPISSPSCTTASNQKPGATSLRTTIQVGVDAADTTPMIQSARDDLLTEETALITKLEQAQRLISEVLDAEPYDSLFYIDGVLTAGLVDRKQELTEWVSETASRPS
jgi:hypothetical protein